jgi:clan AA aspartic protease
MKIGTVDSSGEALVSLTVGGPGSEGQQRDLVALLDTGFNGFLALPPALIDVLDLEQTSREQYMTASGAMHFTGVYEAVVVFGERRLVVDEIVEAAEPLVGVGLLWEFEVCLGYRGGGEVTLEEL